MSSKSKVFGSRSTMLIFVVLTSLSFGAQGGPCDEYINLNENDRSVLTETIGRPKCDIGLAPGWYRFSGAAGSTMAEYCVPINRCATQAPVWLNGQHPTVAEGVVDRTACAHWDNACCNWQFQIRVKNCGSFYVYELTRPPTCSLRYCGAPQPTPPTTTTTTTPTTTTSP